MILIKSSFAVDDFVDDVVHVGVDLVELFGVLVVDDVLDSHEELVVLKVKAAALVSQLQQHT